MKTSNKLLIAALLLLLGALTAFNQKIRAEYARGAYKDPNANSTALDFRNFTDVDVQAAGLVGVRVVAGPYAVRLDNAAASYVKVRQQGARLTVALVFPKERESLGSREPLTISLPRLRQLTASGTYAMSGRLVTEKAGNGLPLRIEGFRQDSLRLRQDHGTKVALANNQLGYLRADAGRTPGSHPVLHIDNTNRIQAASLVIHSQGELRLEAGGIPDLRTQFGDSARATLTGAALRSLGQR